MISPTMVGWVKDATGSANSALLAIAATTAGACALLGLAAPAALRQRD